MSEGRGPESGYIPSEEELSGVESKESPELAKLEKVKIEKHPVTSPEKEEKENETKPDPRKEFGEYSREELVAAVRKHIENMNARAERIRLKEILKALWEKLSEREKKVLIATMGEIFKTLRKAGYSSEAIFEALSETLQSILDVIEKRERK